MVDVFTSELTFGPASVGIMTPTSPGIPYRTIQLATAVNLFTDFISEFDNAAWTKSELTVSADVEDSADKLIPSAAAARHFFSRDTGQSGINDITIALDMKADGYNFGALGLTNEAGNWSVYQFGLAAGTLVGANGAGGLVAATGYISALGGGWYRCVAVFDDINISDATNAVAMSTFGGDAIFEGVSGNGTDGILAKNFMAAIGQFPSGS